MTEEQYEFVGGVQMKLVDHLGGRDIYEISHTDVIAKDKTRRFRGYADGVQLRGDNLTLSFHLEPLPDD